MKFSGLLMALSSKSIATATARANKNGIAYLLDAYWLWSRRRRKSAVFQ